MTTSRKYYGNLDLLKAIAIYFVVVYHFNFSDYDFLISNSAKPYFNYIPLSVLSTCVPIFFFVNGILLFGKETFDLRKHISKTLQLIVLTIIWGVITMVMLSFIWQEPVGIRNVFLGIKELKQGWVNHLWFMEALVIIYFFFPLFYLAFHKSKEIFWWIFGVVSFFSFGNYLLGIGAVAISEVTGKFLHTELMINHFSEFNPFRGSYGFPLAYFLLGGAAWSFQKTMVKKIHPAWAWTVLLLSSSMLSGFAVLYSHRTNQIWDLVFEGYESIFTLINLLALFLITFHYVPKGWFGKIVRLTSENTLGIYFVHWILANLFRPLLPNNPFGDSFAIMLVFGLGIMLASLAIVILLKKVPILKRLFTLG